MEHEHRNPDGDEMTTAHTQSRITETEDGFVFDFNPRLPIGTTMAPKGHGPVTMAMADDFEKRGQYELAEIARKYAVDRPRWWHRFTRRQK